MHAKPMKRYGRPYYPTRLEALRDADLLKQHVPPRWQTAEMAGTVALLLAVNGCMKQEPVAGSRPETPPQTTSVSSERGPVDGLTAKALRQAAVVAPIFEHGTGRGVTGCIVVAPPVFLSEEEALLVITEQLKQAGVEVAKTNMPLAHVNINQGGQTKALVADGATADGTVAFEFVSRSDYFNFGGLRSGSTVQSYNLLSAAKSLTEQAAQGGKGVFLGVFYDPLRTVDFRDDMGMHNYAGRWEEKSPAVREESKRLLREQVSDFVDWLQGQGVI
jgi:hypothetical protein